MARPIAVQARRHDRHRSAAVEAALGRSLKTYIDDSILNSSGSEGYVLRARSRARGRSGNTLAVVESTSIVHGQELHYLSMTTLGAGHFVTATFTATDARFAEISSQVEPHLRTLRAI